MNQLTNKLTIGFSPCPNDCFIFDALIHNKIDTEGLQFEVVMEDVEALNQKAFRGELDITKLSYHGYAYLTKLYQLLDAGSALGNNCGPLLISKSNDIPYLTTHISDLKIAIPGKYTTANFLLSLAFPEAKNKIEHLFSDIEEAVLTGKVDAGLIIHENRFTYEQKGLKKIIDLGEYWEKLANAPIPLGGIVIKRNLPDELKQKVNRIVRKSVEYAFANPKSSLNFVKANAQEMSEEVMYKHIGLYVNNYSVDLGAEGKRAIKILFDKAQESGVINKIEEDIFL
ncbi:MAG: 1,4-dihydroxy-6-naphthoate synthase [Bacteroidetes bacterium RIFCSPLOWO2_12_FULL_35_15]|nr:MAG: 1,4-dihydroxy-6-naphthoate synthase [Bacteroidetes bacterium RIFCSPLOWO2_12_FULL_35_15]